MINKTEFIARLAKKGYTKKDAAVIVEDFLLTLREALVSGEGVCMRGFGNFEVKKHAERKSISPATKEICVVPAHMAPKFTAGSILKEEVKAGKIKTSAHSA